MEATADIATAVTMPETIKPKRIFKANRELSFGSLRFIASPLLYALKMPLKKRGGCEAGNDAV
jgi:hypothetical protein